jgi:hypothetical protein
MIEDFRRTRELAQLNENIAAFYASLPDLVINHHPRATTVLVVPLSTTLI